jgi:hypothetical protein
MNVDIGYIWKIQKAHATSYLVLLTLWQGLKLCQSSDFNTDDDDDG